MRRANTHDRIKYLTLNPQHSQHCGALLKCNDIAVHVTAEVSNVQFSYFVRDDKIRTI